MSWSKEELQAYDYRGMRIQVELGIAEYALEEGIKGSENDKRKIAEKLKTKGVPLDIIVDTTGISLEEIEKLSHSIVEVSIRKVCQQR